MANRSQNVCFPQVFCQRLEHNEVLCSLMSSVFQRSIHSQRRVERNRRQFRQQLDEVSTTMDGNFVRRSYNGYGNYARFLLIVVESTNSTSSCTTRIMQRAKNRGFTLVHLSWNDPISKNEEDLRIALQNIVRDYPNHQRYLCIAEASPSDLAPHDFLGIYLTSSQSPNFPESVPVLWNLPSIEYRDNALPSLPKNPYCIVVVPPEDTLDKVKHDDWIAQCAVQFVLSLSLMRRSKL